MRLVGVSLMLFGTGIAWYLGVKGEDTATLRAQLFSFFHIQDPGTVLPQAGDSNAAKPLSGLGLPAGSILGSGAGLAANAARAAADAAKRALGSGALAPALVPAGRRNS